MSKALFFKEARLGELARLNYGKSPQGLNFGEGTVPVVGTGEEIRYADRYLVDHSSIVIARKGTLGKPTFIEGKFWPIDTTFYLSHFKDVSPKYLYYLLGTVDLTRLNESTGVPSLSRDTLKRIHLRIPDPEYQSYVVNIFADIDQQIAHTAAIITKHERLRAGLLHDLLTYGIDEHGQLRSEQTHAFQDSPIGRIPAEWTVENLGKVAFVTSGVTLNNKLSAAGSIEVPYLRVANVQDGYLDLAEIKTVTVTKAAYEKALLQPGDVLMNEGGDYDKLGRGAVWQGQISPCLHQNHVFKVRCKPDALLPDYLAYFSASSFGKRFFIVNSKQSTNLASINSTQLKSFPVALPDINEQKKIVETVANQNRVMESYQRQLTKLQRLKTGLMQDLLTPTTSETVVAKAAELVESLSV